MIAGVPDYQDSHTSQAALDSVLDGTKASFYFERRRALTALGTLLHSSSRPLRAWAHERLAGIDGAKEGSNATTKSSIDAAIDLEAVVSLLEARDPIAVRPAHLLLSLRPTHRTADRV